MYALSNVPIFRFYSNTVVDIWIFSFVGFFEIFFRQLVRDKHFFYHTIYWQVCDQDELKSTEIRHFSPAINKQLNINRPLDELYRHTIMCSTNQLSYSFWLQCGLFVPSGSGFLIEINCSITSNYVRRCTSSFNILNTSMSNYLKKANSILEKLNGWYFFKDVFKKCTMYL